MKLMKKYELIKVEIAKENSSVLQLEKFNSTLTSESKSITE